MPNVTAPTRQMGNGDVVTQFVDSVGTSAVTYTYPKTQEKFRVRCMGPSSLSVTIAGVTQTVQAGEKWEKVADFTSFTINGVGGFTAFDAWTDEKGSTFDSAEGKYFATGVVGTSGVVFEALINGETVTIDTSVPPAIPAVPTGLAANPQSTQVSLTWNAMSGATSYKVYRGGTLIASPTSASYVDTGLTNGTSYSYTVSAVNSGGESAQSSAITATPVAPSLPATPAAPTATAGNAQVALTWTSVSGATGYKVYRGGTLIASPTATSYTDTTAVNGTAYSYTVSATNAAGESPQSAATSATPVAPTSTILFSDNFNRTADAAAVGNGWVPVGMASSTAGTWGISANGEAYLVAAPTTDSALYHSTTASDNIMVSTKFVTLKHGSTRLVWRMADSENLFAVQNNAAGTALQIFKRKTGSWALVGTDVAGAVIAPNDIVSVKLVGNVHEIFINSVSKRSFTDADFNTATNHGVGTAIDTTAKWDDFEVKTV